MLGLLLIPSFGVPWRRSLGAFAAGGTVALGLFPTQARFSRAYFCRVGRTHALWALALRLIATARVTGHRRARTRVAPG